MATFLSTRRLFVALLFGSLFIMSLREVSDPDFWWHLRTGQYIVETGTIPHADIFSFTNSGKEWVAHEWLSEVLLYSVFTTGGIPSLVILFASLIAFSFAILYTRCRGKPYIAGFVVLLSALSALPTFGVRPQMLSVLFSSVYLLCLERYQQNEDSRLAWLLVPLMTVWSNIHSGFAFGIVVLAVFAGNALLQNRIRPSLLISQRARTLTLVLICATLAVALNPNGLRLYTYPFETLSSASMQSYIQEWFSPDFHAVEFQPFALLLIGLIAAGLTSRSTISFPSLVLLVIMGYASLRSARNIPLFVLIAVPVLAQQLDKLAGRIHWRPAVDNTMPRQKPVFFALNYLVLFGLLLAVALRVNAVSKNQPLVETTKFPAAATDYVAANCPLCNIFNSYGWGGYLIWRLQPSGRVYIDGRADVYGDTFIEDYLTIYRADKGWQDRLSSQGVRIALVEPASPIAQAMSTSPAWHCVYSDKVAAVFEKNQ